jgi:dienelactone hydrolase
MKGFFEDLQAASVVTKGVMIVGYCFGGRYAIRHASRDCVAAAAFHPVCTSSFCFRYSRVEADQVLFARVVSQEMTARVRKYRCSSDALGRTKWCPPLCLKI